MSEKRTVLIGGTGFIGSALAQALVSPGERVVSISRHLPEVTDSGVEYVALDLVADATALRQHLKKGDTVFLLTGQNRSGFDAEEEKRSFGKILAAIGDILPEKVIFASSALVYGDCSDPADESHILDPQDEYSAFKAECEQLIRDGLPEIPVAIVRLANVYGSEQNKGFVGLVFKKMLEGSIVMVNGDGGQERDYIFLDDVVAALLAVKEGLKESDTINIATGRSETLLAVIAAVTVAAGREVKYDVTDVPVPEVSKSRIDNRKLREKYGFTPKIFLKEGMWKTWERYNKKT